MNNGAAPQDTTTYLSLSSEDLAVLDLLRSTFAFTDEED